MMTKPDNASDRFCQRRTSLASLDFHERVLPIPTLTNPAKSARFLLPPLMIAMTYFLILHMPTSLVPSQGISASRLSARFFQGFLLAAQLLVNWDLSRSISWI